MAVEPGLRRKFFGLGALFVALLVCLAAAGVWFYRTQASSDRLAARDQLVTVADFKVAQLAAWRRERLDDAAGIARDALFVRAIADVLRTGSADALESAQASLRPSMRADKYDAFILLRHDLSTILAMGAPTALAPDVAEHVAAVLATRDTVFPHIELNGGTPAYLDLYAPVIDVGGEAPVEAILVMRIDPASFIIPLVDLWPAPLRTAETLLVAGSSHEVEFVLPPRWSDGRPIAVGSSLPVALAARGAAGYFDGLDMRGVHVLAAIRRVPDSNWALVAKVDASEVEGPLRERAFLLGTSAAGLLAAAAIGVLLLVSREQRLLYQGMYEQARERQAIADRFEALSRLANDTMVLADIDGRILDVNDRGLETYGYTLDEFKRMALRDLRPPDYVPSPDENLQAVQARLGMRFETLHRRRDGATFPVEVSARLVDVEGRLFVQGIIRDISEQKRSARQILRLNRLLDMRSRINQAIVQLRDPDELLAAVTATAVESGGFTLAIISTYEADSATIRVRCFHGRGTPRVFVGATTPVGDLRTGGPTSAACLTGRVALCNDIATDPRAEGWRDEALQVGFLAAAATPIREGGRITSVLALYAPEVGYFDGRMERILVEIGQDLSFALDSLAAERERRQVEAQFRTLFEAAPFALCDIDRDSGRILNANPSAARLYGLPEDSCRGRSAREIFGPDDLRAPADDDLARAPLVTRHRRADGQPIDVEVYCRAVTIDSRPAWFVAVADITERKLLEEQFRQAHRMEAVGRLAGGVAHDFNNLLTAITGFATLTLGDLAPDNPHRGHIEQIRKAAERAAGLTRQLLAFSRRQVLQARAVDLNQTIAELGKMLQRLVGEDLHLALELTAARAVVQVDPTQIEQVLMNLAVNARDAMPRGGTLRIETARVTAADAATRGTSRSLPPGTYVRLTVEDTGTGMSPDVQARIFEPFFTTKPTGAGTGLGLSTVHGIVTQSGGVVAVDSAPGAGTRFTIYLPALDEQAAETRPPEAPGTDARGHETILLVEDDEGVRQLAMDVLARGGYRVHGAASGAQALDRFEALGAGAIDLLVTDIVMPRMSGIELSREFDRLSPGLRVLFMSGYPDEALARHGLVAEPANFLQKPFTPDSLLAAVRRVLDRAATTSP
ncbi:MAG: PAS domain S-box protein [Vicinamibacterales bacterium]